MPGTVTFMTSSDNLANQEPASESPPFPIAISVLILLILAGLSLILGIIYGYLYFTRISPKRSRSYSVSDSSGKDDGNSRKHTHLMFFHKK